MIRNKKTLTGLHHSQYEHPFDKKALEILEKTPGLSAAGKYIIKQAIERIYRIQYTGSNLKIDVGSYPLIYDYLDYACQILDWKEIPELYLQWGFGIHSLTIGYQSPLVILNSGIIDLCDDDEKLFVIGHEIAHIKSGHTLYHLMAQVINYIIDLVPGGSVVAAPLQYALLYWDRMSDFSADRAGLLCCQNMDAAIRVFVKMAGLPQGQHPNLNCSAFLEQAKAFDILDYEGLNRLFKFISIAGSDQPWTVMRAAELLKWVDAGGYSRCLGLDPSNQISTLENLFNQLK